jgi:hypothetical protein
MLILKDLLDVIEVLKKVDTQNWDNLCDPTYMGHLSADAFCARVRLIHSIENIEIPIE